MQTNIIHEIEKLYKELPEVDCTQCGICCVSPTCTLSEFIYLFHVLQNTSSTEKIIRYLQTPPELHPDYNGNVRCFFLEEKSCAIHPARTGACRLFGIPSLKELNLSNLEACRHHIEIVSGNSDISFIQSWLEKLCQLDRKLYDYAAEPYFIKGFNLHCWLDIYFDDSLDFDIFNDIKQVLKQYVDLAEYKNYYTSQTGLKEKIDKIGILSALLSSGDKALLHPLLLSIRDDYPATGTYFYDEAVAYLDVLDKNENST